MQKAERIWFSPRTTSALFRLKSFQKQKERFATLKSDNEKLRSVRLRVEESTGHSGQEKLRDDDEILHDGLNIVIRRIVSIEESINEKETIWEAMKEKSAAISAELNRICAKFDEAEEKLDEIEVRFVENSIRFDSIDFFQEVLSALKLVEEETENLISATENFLSNDERFFVEKSFEENLFETRRKIRQKIGETKKKIFDVRSALRQNEIFENLSAEIGKRRTRLVEIGREISTDEESTRKNATNLIEEISQIESWKKNFVKFFSAEQFPTLKIELDKCSKFISDELILLKRVENEQLFLKKLAANAERFQKQIDENENLRSLELVELEIDEEIRSIDEEKNVKSNFYRNSLKNLREQFLSMKNQIRSIVERQNRKLSLQTRLDEFLHKFNEKLRNRPNFERNFIELNFRQNENNFRQTFMQAEQILAEIRTTIDLFDDENLRKTNELRLNKAQEDFQRVNNEFQQKLELLRQVERQQTNFNHKIGQIVEQFHRIQLTSANFLQLNVEQIKVSLDTENSQFPCTHVYSSADRKNWETHSEFGRSEPK